MEQKVHALAATALLLFLSMIFASIILPQGVYLGHWAPALLVAFTVLYTSFAIRQRRHVQPR